MVEEKRDPRCGTTCQLNQDAVDHCASCQVEDGTGPYGFALSPLPTEQPKGRVTYAFCDDWFIYGKGENGKLYWVSTELWPEWFDLPEDADQEPNAVEKYMLSIARKKWYSLLWREAKTDEES